MGPKPLEKRGGVGAGVVVLGRPVSACSHRLSMLFGGQVSLSARANISWRICGIYIMGS